MYWPGQWLPPMAMADVGFPGVQVLSKVYTGRMLEVRNYLPCLELPGIYTITGRYHGTVFGLVMAAVPGRAVLCATLWRFVSCVLVLCVGPGPSLCL